MIDRPTAAPGHGAQVVVTGGAGFIGSELVRQLVERGCRVRVIDSLVNGRRENLADLLNRVDLRTFDIRNGDAVASALRDTSVLFHLACLGVRHSIHSPRENHDVNASATLSLLDAARSAGVGRVVHVSTSEVYGTATVTPMSETHPTFPCTVYGASKLAGECYARAYWLTYGFPTVVVRPFNTYGPRCHHEGDSGEVIPKFVLRALAGRPLIVFGDGEQTRDFTHVRDTARGIMQAGFAPGVAGMTINIGSGTEISVNALADAVRAIVGPTISSVERMAGRPGDVRRLRADITRAEKTLRFLAVVPLTDGLRDLEAWYLARSESPEELLAQEIERNWEQPGSHGLDAV